MTDGMWANKRAKPRQEGSTVGWWNRSSVNVQPLLDVAVLPFKNQVLSLGDVLGCPSGW